jgi:hypothetical protein
MARRNSNDKRRGLWLFGAKKKIVQPVATKPDSHFKSDSFRFALRQLSFQSAYFPELLKLHNDFITKPSYHKGAKGRKNIVLSITGKRSVDLELALNFHRMMALEKKINALRLQARSIRHLEHAKDVVDKARMLESKFNDIKEKNFLIFLEHFPQPKK